MPCYPNSKSGKIVPILIVLCALIALGVLVVVLKGGSFSKLEPFPAAAYLDGPSDFLGNEYRMQAQIDAQLNWEKGTGRLLAVLPDGANSRLPVFVPAEAGSNLHVGQRYEMRVRIEEGGLIYVEELRKF